jgi:Zn finger protein HypA/HybF involved in hydrogenase expression
MGLLTVDKKNKKGNKKRTTEEFVDLAITAYDGKYTYENTEYKGAKNKVIVTCPEHGDFEVVATTHLNNGVGCPHCRDGGTPEERFIEKAIKTYGNKYGYDDVKITSSTSKVKIKCAKHGIFEQSIHWHLQGSGCPLCSNENVSKNKTKSFNTFCEEAREVHGNKYTYVGEYKSANEKIEILCPQHGSFEQTAKHHLSGSGCPKCASANRKNTWSYSDWEKAGKLSSNFEGYSVYVIKCTGNGEEFIKIGKTYTGVAKRFCGEGAMPYKYKVVTQVYHNAYAISKLEEKLHKHFKEHKYKPKREFGGMYECYDPSILDEAVEKAEK